MKTVPSWLIVCKPHNTSLELMKMKLQCYSIFVAVKLVLFHVVTSTTWKNQQTSTAVLDVQLDPIAWKRLWQDLTKNLDSLNPAEEMKTCNLIVFTESKGTISSPNFPHTDYSNNLNCSYIIQVEDGHRIRLVFTTFSTEQDNDYVMVYDGLSVNDAILLRTSGRRTTPMQDDVVTSGSKCLVTFKSDRSVTSMGWKIVYSSLILASPAESNSNPVIADSADPYVISVKSSCENTVKNQTREGMIHSPNYPNNYDNERICIWNLSAPSDRYRIRLDFLSFETEHCCDFMTVFDGPTTVSKVLLSASGSTIPDQVLTSGTQCIIRFKTDWIENVSGWLIAYSIIPFDTNDRLLSLNIPVSSSLSVPKRAITLSASLFVENASFRSSLVSPFTTRITVSLTVTLLVLILFSSVTI